MLEKLLFDLGGKALPKLIGMKFGAEAGKMAEIALEALGEAFGVAPEPRAIETAIERKAAEDPGRARGAVVWAEAKVSEQLLAMAEVMRQGNEQQRLTNELLTEQLKAPGWRSDWLFVWQWFLMAAWGWTLIVVHILNAAIRIVSGAPADAAVSLPAPDLGVLVTLTGLYLGLHMGGHTVLELMRGGTFKRKIPGED